MSLRARRALRFVHAASLALALMAVLPAAAAAYCGGIQRAQPTKSVTDNRAPLIVGDSVLLGAIDAVAREGFEVNAHGCRGWRDGVAYLRARRHARTLPRLVVLQLGTNWSITLKDIRKALDVTGSRRVLAIVTPREVGGHGGSDARAVRAAGRHYPDRIAVLDWVRHTRAKSHWFAPDGIHLSQAGVRGLARFLGDATKYADGISTLEDQAG